MAGHYPMQSIPLVDLSLLGAAIQGASSVRLAEILEPLRRRLLQPMMLEEAKAIGPATIGVCRRLYAHARSRDALPLALALLDQSGQVGDAELMRRAATACGLLRGDTGDIVGALEHHVQSLRVSVEQGNSLDASRDWNNLGLTFSLAGNYLLAVRCSVRALNELREVAGPAFNRYVAYSNGASGRYHLGEYEEGLRMANLALEEAVPAFLDEDPHSAILLRRNLVRLLLANGRVPEAQARAEELAALAERAGTPRAFVAAAAMRALCEMATGQFDLALTRLDRALVIARTVPAILRDVLACAVRVEEAAGFPDRALLRLRELADHEYAFGVERARNVVEFKDLLPGYATASSAQLQRANARLVGKLDRRGVPEGWETLRRIAIGAALRVDRTGWHGMRVASLTRALALESGCPPLEALEIGLAAELHDIGISSVPDSILTKPGELNEVERALMERHTDAGAEILRDDREPRMLLARDIARYHHARWDGRGYPDGVAGHSIPVAARMCAIANAYDDLACGHGGRVALSMGKALADLARRAGTEFDPEMVRRFEAMVRRQVHERDIDTTAVHGFESFRQLMISLEGDEGFP